MSVGWWDIAIAFERSERRTIVFEAFTQFSMEVEDEVAKVFMFESECEDEEEEVREAEIYRRKSVLFKIMISLVSPLNRILSKICSWQDEQGS